MGFSVYQFISIAYAQRRRPARGELPDAASPDVLFWITVFTLGFVLGAIDGLLILTLRRLKYKHAGTRWTFGFWAGVFWAPITLIIARAFTSWAGPLTSPLALTLITMMNVGGVWWIAKWAAREDL